MLQVAGVNQCYLLLNINRDHNRKTKNKLACQNLKLNYLYSYHTPIEFQSRISNNSFY